jgi:hypothetical protein
MPDKKIDVSLLAQAVDNTFGRSSTPKTASYSVKITFSGPDMLVVSYVAVVNFGNEREMIMMKRQYADEAKSVIKEYLKHVKSTYKELSGESVTLTVKDCVDSLEVISMNSFNPKRTCYFRSKCLVEVS